MFRSLPSDTIPSSNRWNSAVYAAIPISSYNVAIVTQDFHLDNKPWNYAIPQLQRLRELANPLKTKPINNTECIKRYTGRDAGLTDLIVVTSNLTMEDQQSFALDNTSSLLFNRTTPNGATSWYIATNWLCSAWQTEVHMKVWCTDEFLGPRSHNWTYRGRYPDFRNPTKEFWGKIDHCIPAGDVHDMEENCALRVSTIILATVCILNLFKCICICWVAQLHRQTSKAINPCHTSYQRGFALLVPWSRASFTKTSQQLHSHTERRPEYLVTIGDAIASFLEEEDTSTIDFPVVSKEDFTGGWPDDSTMAKEPLPMRWHCAASKRRWLVTISM